jgi:hypothetical protein
MKVFSDIKEIEPSQIKKTKAKKLEEKRTLKTMKRNLKVKVNLKKSMNHLQINPEKKVQYFEAGHINTEMNENSLT